MTQDYAHIWQFVNVIAGDPSVAILDWRAIHDTDKADKGHARRGTLDQWWHWLCEMNNTGYGIFAVINALDGNGRELNNVSYIRNHFIDLDDIQTSIQMRDMAMRHVPAPAFLTTTSPNKFHLYWPVNPYTGNDYFQIQQRKLRQMFGGDRTVIDATRVMRVPGFYHLKNPTTPHLVAGEIIGDVTPIRVEDFAASLAHINVIEGGDGERHDLGDPDLAAPSLDWVAHALKLVDPNDLDRGEWVAIMSAIKQSAWSLAEEHVIYAMWSEWCERYTVGEGNDPGENLKQWNSIRNTQLGWKSLLNRVPSLKAAFTFAGRPVGSAQTTDAAPTANLAGGAPIPSEAPTPAPPPIDCSGEYLTHLECEQWFDGCTYIIGMGRVLTRDLRFLQQGQFNAQFGGKIFIITEDGKTTDEAYKAATRSTMYQIPKVDHVRFLPSEPSWAVVSDELGRTGINVYRPVNVRRVAGDATPFLRHIGLMLPDPGDQKILLDYMAHNVKYPGEKIAWAPVIQSVEGIGKGIVKSLMLHAMGKPYVHFPNAQELTNSGSQFNSWMRHKLFLLADEIKVDDRQDLIEILKPMISEKLIEVQAKGIDQDLEDNNSNWMFFTNYKNAIPIKKSSRRYCIFFSPVQTDDDKIARGMDKKYFDDLHNWMEADGAAIVTDWLMNYPIERRALPHEAPRTSSFDEAIRISRSPLERVIFECIEDQLDGFRGGWVSSLAAVQQIKAAGAVRGSVSPETIGSVLEGMGYVSCGRATRAYFKEDAERRAYLWHFGGMGNVAEFGRAQGYE